jgi:prephenate dehydratase
VGLSTVHMKNLVKWIIGISFIIVGLSRLIEGSVISILFIVVGLLGIPPFLAYVEAESDFHLPRSWKYTGVIFVFLIIVATSEKDKAKTPIDDVVKSAPPTIPTLTEYSIVSSIETFRKRFNAFMSEVNNGSIKIENLSVDDGEVNNVFQYMLTDHIAIVGQLNKSDNSIRSLILTLQGDGTMQSGMDIMTTIMGVVDATNPGISPKERGEVLKELGLFKKGIDINKIDSRATKNGIEYSLQGSEMIGLMFAVESEGEDN